MTMGSEADSPLLVQRPRVSLHWSPRASSIWSPWLSRRREAPFLMVFTGELELSPLLPSLPLELLT
jgi:hypothetical protein